MKVTTILGSPRIKGNTSKVLEKFEKIIKLMGHEIDRINIIRYKVNGCLGCNKCRTVLDEPGCVQKDDFISLFKRILVSDIIIYASPLYVWGYTAQIKPLIDRQYCLVKNYGKPEYKSFLKDKKVALLVTCGDNIENNADLIPIIFQRESDYLGSTVIGKYIVPLSKDLRSFGQRANETAKMMADDIIKCSGTAVEV